MQSPETREPAYKAYQDEMILLGHGFLVWYGDPYKGQEIQIGDVGYMVEGAFRCIRRRSEPYDMSRAEKRLMDFRTPLFSRHLKQRGFLAAGPGAEITTLAADAEGRVLLSTSRRAFAALSLEQGNADFISCPERDKDAIGEEFLQNAHSWLREAIIDGNLPANFQIGRLIIVTGFYKTWNWTAISMSSESSKGGLSFSVKAAGLGSGRLSYDWNDIQDVSPAFSSGHNHPYGSAPSATVFTPPASELFANCCRGHRTVRNQCIFLRGFRYRERLSRKDELKGLAQPVDYKPSFLQRYFFGRIPKLTGTPASGAPAVTCNAQEQIFYAHLEPIDGLPDLDACDALYDAVALEKFTQDKDLTAVVVHDDELITRLERYQSGEKLQDPTPEGSLKACQP